jgi:hypothetical protein
MRPTERNSRKLSELLSDFPEGYYRPVSKSGRYLELRPRYWLYVYFRFYRKEDGKVVSGCRPFSKARPALRFISQYAGKNLIDDVYFVDSKERKSYDVYCDYNNIKLLPLQASFDFHYE